MHFHHAVAALAGLNVGRHTSSHATALSYPDWSISYYRVSDSGYVRRLAIGSEFRKSNDLIG